jgi:hypothetical protein
MGLFNKIFGSSGASSDPLVTLRKRLKDGRRVTLDYGIYVRELLAEKYQKGLIDRSRVDPAIIAEMFKDWEERLERIVYYQIIDEVEKLGKKQEFDLVLDSDIDPDVYLTNTIPDYSGFLIKAVMVAKTKI